MNEDQGNSGLGEPSAESQLTGCRHQAEKIAFENKMLRAVLDPMPDNISIKDLQGRYIFDNSPHCRFLSKHSNNKVMEQTDLDTRALQHA